jgi:hypothetical protein
MGFVRFATSLLIIYQASLHLMWFIRAVGQMPTWSLLRENHASSTKTFPFWATCIFAKAHSQKRTRKVHSRNTPPQHVCRSSFLPLLHGQLEASFKPQPPNFAPLLTHWAPGPDVSSYFRINFRKSLDMPSLAICPLHLDFALHNGSFAGQFQRQGSG